MVIFSNRWGQGPMVMSVLKPPPLPEMQNQNVLTYLKNDYL